MEGSTGGLTSNGFGEHSPQGYSLGAGIVTEIVMTMMFLVIILGATDKRAPAGFAPIAIGLGLTLIHLIRGDTGTSPLRLAARPSMARSVADIPVGSRSQGGGTHIPASS